MNIFTNRRSRSRKEKFKRKRNQVFILVNLFLCYLLLLSFSDITSSTYSYFSDNTQFTGSIKNMEDFCKDKEYKEKYCKDNSGRGNGSEPVDEQDDEFGDEDNPGHPEDCREEDQTKCDDHPKSGNGNSTGQKKIGEEQGQNSTVPSDPTASPEIKDEEETVGEPQTEEAVEEETNTSTPPPTEESSVETKKESNTTGEDAQAPAEEQKDKENKEREKTHNF